MIYLDNRQNEIEVKEEFIKDMERVISFALKEEEVLKECEISLVLVNNEEIKTINLETRGIDKATDVLSFPMLEYNKGKVFKDIYKDCEFDEIYLDGEELVLGDIVISLEKALEQSKEYNHSFERESFYLIVHSILHLLGYDHMEEDEKVIMRKREEEILGKLDIKR